MLKVNACLSIVLTSVIFFTDCAKKKCVDPTPEINDTSIMISVAVGNNWFNLQNPSTRHRLIESTYIDGKTFIVGLT